MVTRSEHLGLGVIYMLCDEYNHITGDTIDTLLCPSKQGRDVLHFATVLGLSTLVREIARHALERFRSRPVTEESSVFAKDSLGNTALDFARILGYEEIQHVLQETLDAAEEFKASALEAPLRPLPDPPVPDRPYRPGSIGNKSSTYILAENGVSTPAHALNRPLPPTPMTSSPQPDMLSTAETSAKPSSLHHSATSTPYLPPQGLPTTYAAVPQSEPAPYLYTPPNSNLLPGNTPYTSSAPCVTPATVSPATFSTSIYPGPITSMPGHQPLYAPPQSFQFPTPASYTSAPAPHPYLPSASYPYPQQHYPFPQQQAPPSPTSMPIPMAQPPPVSMPTPHLPPPAPLTASPVPNFTNPYALLENQQTSPYRTNSSPYLQSGITPQGQSSPQSAYQSVIAPFRPLPLTPGGSVPSLPLPPPKHKVTQVNRPKQFTIPSATSPQQSDQLGLNPAHSPALQPYNPFVQYQDPQIKVPIP
ncbi:hypothetical protein BGW38_000286 [Lunasporangiospora selenospora]|uniref:Ankyrin repeat-containing protein n=1 Tax=Lunasporangiospora selenospora TaxID=979761 RepID=A0A9P6KF25_9FUNG|nr:hypothetical protein BGW38_000286 [Lunasporangiospora selenospora]